MEAKPTPRNIFLQLKFVLGKGAGSTTLENQRQSFIQPQYCYWDQAALPVFPRGMLDTTLHPDKDLAVSLLTLPSGLILIFQSGYPKDFRLQASLLAPRGLLQAGVTRYLATPYGVNVRTFLCHFCLRQSRSYKNEHPCTFSINPLRITAMKAKPTPRKILFVTKICFRKRCGIVSNDSNCPICLDKFQTQLLKYTLYHN